MTDMIYQLYRYQRLTSRDNEDEINGTPHRRFVASALHPAPPVLHQKRARPFQREYHESRCNRTWAAGKIV